MRRKVPKIFIKFWTKPTCVGPLQPFQRVEPTKGPSKSAKKYMVGQTSLKTALKIHSTLLTHRFRFCVTDIQAIIHIFWKLSDGKMYLSGDGYKHFLKSMFNYDQFWDIEIRGYDRFSDEQVKITEFTRNMWVLLRGSLEERARFTFEVYDQSGMRYLSREDVTHFLTRIVQVVGQRKVIAIDYERRQIFLDFLIRKLMDRSRMKITKESFVQFVKENPFAIECLLPVWPNDNYVRLWKQLLLK